MMATHLRLFLDGVEAMARLHEDAAPQTVARLWAVLPISDRLRHLRWGGEAGYIMVAQLSDPDHPLENAVTFYPPGAIMFRRDHGEIAVAYGQAQARDHMQPATWACHVATLDGGAEAFLRKVQATRSEGAKAFRIERGGE